MTTSSQPPSIQELKRTLVAAGLEIYRTRPDAVHLAERPRDNQILDAGISVRPTLPEGSIEVRVVMRCQRSDFQREPAEELYEKVRELARPELGMRAFRELETREQRMPDPGDKSKTLDVWYEVVFGKTFTGVQDAIVDAKYALSLEKYVRGPGHP
ncbi:MAG: hypothetical protein NVS3B10_08210 [Polyangiales bacterium]